MSDPDTVPNIPAQMRKMKVHLAVPVLDRPDLHFANTLFQATTSSRMSETMVNWNANDSMISRARNILLSDFLFRSDAEYLMMLDSDLELVNCHADNNIIIDFLLENLQKPGVDFVGGLYSVKAPNANKSSSVDIDFGPVPPYGSTGKGCPEFLHEMRWLSTGCMMIRRSVVVHMLKKYPELVYDGDGMLSGRQMFGAFIPFLLHIEKGELKGSGERDLKKYLSEDWSFCERWRKIGGKIWSDSRIVLRHYGSYPYDLYVRKPAGTSDQAPKEQPAPLQQPDTPCA